MGMKNCEGLPDPTHPLVWDDPRFAIWSHHIITTSRCVCNWKFKCEDIYLLIRGDEFRIDHFFFIEKPINIKRVSIENYCKKSVGG